MEKVNIKAAVFDLDGTLLDTLPAIRYFVNLFMKEHSLLPLSLGETAKFVGDGAAKLVERAIVHSGIELASESGRELFAKIHPEYVREYNKDPAFMTEPYAEIPEAIEALSRGGIRLGILSNKPHETVVQLAEKYFPGLFEVVLGARSDIPLKPKPDGALEVCRALGVSPSEVAYFGDTGVDMKTGRAFGAGLTVGVLWGFREREELLRDGAGALIERPSEIYDLIMGDKK